MGAALFVRRDVFDECGNFDLALRSSEDRDMWIRITARGHRFYYLGEPLAVIRWNNELKCRRVSELPDRYQEYYETYIPQFCPNPNRIRFFFDVYDADGWCLKPHTWRPR